MQLEGPVTIKSSHYAAAYLATFLYCVKAKAFAFFNVFLMRLFLFLDISFDCRDAFLTQGWCFLDAKRVHKKHANP